MPYTDIANRHDTQMIQTQKILNNFRMAFSSASTSQPQPSKKAKRDSHFDKQWVHEFKGIIPR